MACQPQPPPDAARTPGDEQERDAEAERAQAVDVESGRVDDPGRRQGGDDRPGIERPRAAIDRPFDEERDPDREDQYRADGLGSREELLEQQQATEHEQEDADPGEAGPASLVGAPFPGVDPHVRRRPGVAAPTVRAEASDGIGLLIHGSSAYSLRDGSGTLAAARPPARGRAM